MKKILALAVASLVLCASLDAQTYDVLDKVRAGWRLRSGMEGPHRLGPSDLGQMSKAPRGYKPFYISHYGRHGSRTAWNSGTYDLIHKVFTQAHEENRLTAKGEEFYRKYEDFYLVPFVNSGDLVPLGYEQHKKIGEWTYDQFPAVFKGAKKVDAVVSTSQRSIVSMGSFCISLKGRNPKLDIYMESSHTNMTIAAPTSAPKQFIRYFKGQFDSPVGESRSAFSSRIVDYYRILGTFFKDVSFLDGFDGGKTKFLSELSMLLCGYQNYTRERIFDGYISDDDMVKIWESSNYSSYCNDQVNRYGNIPLLEDVIEKAEAAFRNPEMAANLRFGHDYVVEAFLTLINANGCGKIVDKAEDAKYWFQNYTIPMATTVLFVFYKNKQGDILFKLVWNEHEATLPQITPVQGNYYRWSDFKAWAKRLMQEHPEVQRPVAEAKAA